MQPRVLLHDARWRGQHYETLLGYDAQWMDTPPAGFADDPGRVVDLVLFSDEFPSAAAIEIARLVRAGVPVLHQLDGVVEWRNVWENPRSLRRSEGLPLFQPCLAHKVACAGAAQVRTLEPWGNAGKCELVVLPRLDPLTQVIRREPEPGRRRILVMTARTPGFTPAQVEAVERGLRDLNAFVTSAGAVVDGAQVELVWRVSAGMDERLGVPPAGPEPLSELLGTVDAVISTPSTAVLEAMAVGLPTAVLDYTNSPPYGQSAWSITAQAHLAQTLRELVDPPLAKLEFQRAAVADQLEFPAASERMWALIREMCRIGGEARAKGQVPSFAARILPAPAGPRWPSAPLEMGALYRENPEFLQRDTMALQAEVGHLRRVLATKEQQIQEWERLMNWRGRALRLYRRVRERRS